MLGDSVVGVKHCIDPKGGKVSRTTSTLFGVGVVSLVVVTVAFCIALSRAARDQARYDYETIALHRPSYSVRRHVLPPVFDWLALGGLAAALITMTSAFVRMRTEKVTPWVRIGTAPDVDFATDRAPKESFGLIEPHGDHFACHFDRRMEGEMVVGGQSTSLAELAAQGCTTISPIPDDARIRIRIGAATFLVSSVVRPRQYATARFALERPFLYSLAGTSAAAALLVLMLFQIAVEDSNANIDLASLEDTSTRTARGSMEEPLPSLLSLAEDEHSGGDEPGQTKPALALPGAMGNPSSTRTEGLYRMKKTAENPQLARHQAIEQARAAGILGTVALARGGAFASLTAADIAGGFDTTNVYGGLVGNEVGDMNGNFGYARSGFGPDSGGVGWGTIGAGRYGTVGNGPGTGPGYQGGLGRARGIPDRAAAVPTVTLCNSSLPTAALCSRNEGDLDKAIIRRYVKRNLQKISYCYEKQLLARPNLSGTVITQFFVAPNGSVTSSQGSGFDYEVATCVADVIHGIEFPKPKNGGGVQVNYPFTFRPAA